MNATQMDYYAILGVAHSATLEEIKRAYRALALRYHPDRAGNTEEAARNFRRLLEAYQTLSDPEQRLQYDRGFTPAASVMEIFRRGAGQRHLEGMLPTAPASPKPGFDLVIDVPVSATVLRDGGLVDIVLPESGERVAVVVPSGVTRYPWGRLTGCGTPGHNGAPAGDLWLRLVPGKEKR